MAHESGRDRRPPRAGGPPARTGRGKPPTGAPKGRGKPDSRGDRKRADSGDWQSGPKSDRKPYPKGSRKPDSTSDRRRGPDGDRKRADSGDWQSGPKSDRKPYPKSSHKPDSTSDRWKGPKSQAERKGRPSREPVDPDRDTSNDLAWPDEIFELELDPELYAELESFGGRTSTLSKHLLSVQVLAESDPEAACQHALRLRTRIPRSALTRQTACIAAYRAGHYKEAVKEEAAYRRISGAFDLVPIAADSERGLGRPQRALDMLTQFDSAKLDPDTRTELFIVAGGARRDLKDDDAARVLLQKAVRAAKSAMAMARARFALGDLLADLGDVEQARKWLQNAADIDEEGTWTDAARRLETLA